MELCLNEWKFSKCIPFYTNDLVQICDFPDELYYSYLVMRNSWGRDSANNDFFWIVRTLMNPSQTKWLGDFYVRSYFAEKLLKFALNLPGDLNLEYFKMQKDLMLCSDKMFTNGNSPGINYNLIFVLILGLILLSF